MKESSLYGHVIELLALAARSRRPADEMVGKFFRERRYLGARDRRFIAEMTFDVVRNQRLLDHVVDSVASVSPGMVPGSRARPFCLLLAYLVVVRRLDKAELIGSLSSLWTAYIRDVTFEEYLQKLGSYWASFQWPVPPIDRLALQYSVHPSVVRDWVEGLGPVEAEALCRASNTASPITARVNTIQCSREECRKSLLYEGIETEPTPLSPDGLVFAKRINAQSLLTFRKGWFEIQDEGSQLVSRVIMPLPGAIILDACAGGGGKTLHLAALMHNEGTIIAADVSKMRIANLKARVQRAGVAIVRVGEDEGRADNGKVFAFDAVLIDAPCSGTGTYRRNPWLKSTFDPESVERLAGAQQQLLRRHAHHVRLGGKLVYSTCSLLRRENEDHIHEFLRSNTQFTLVSAGEILAKQGIGIEGTSPFLSLYPHRHRTDGFFVAVMERNVERSSTSKDVEGE